MMGCPWGYLAKWPNDHNGMPLGISKGGYRKKEVLWNGAGGI